MSRKLIFHADDYGLSPAVSAGILQAQRGVVRATSVMAHLATPDELVQLKAEPLSIGVHLTLTCGAPLSRRYPATLLRQDGSFDKALALKDETWQARDTQEAVLAEWRAQLSALEAAGLKLDHLDSHHHVHLLPALFPLALNLARAHGLALRTRTAQRAAAREAGLATPDALVEGFFGETQLTRETLFKLLAQARGEVVEVVCHPGLVDEFLTARSTYVSERPVELRVLGDPRLAGELQARGWRLCGDDWH